MSVFFIVYPLYFFEVAQWYHQNFKIKLKFYKNLSSKYVMIINRIELLKKTRYNVNE